MEFNFKNIKKEFLRVTLPDGSKITFGPPKWGVFKKLQKLDIKTDGDAFRVLAELLNTNMEGKKFTEASASETFDLADMYEFMTIYMEFLNKAIDQKN